MTFRIFATQIFQLELKRFEPETSNVDGSFLSCLDAILVTCNSTMK